MNKVMYSKSYPMGEFAVIQDDFPSCLTNDACVDYLREKSGMPDNDSIIQQYLDDGFLSALENDVRYYLKSFEINRERCLLRHLYNTWVIDETMVIKFVYHVENEDVNRLKLKDPSGYQLLQNYGFFDNYNVEDISQ